MYQHNDVTQMTRLAIITHNACVCYALLICWAFESEKVGHLLGSSKTRYILRKTILTQAAKTVLFFKTSIYDV